MIKGNEMLEQLQKAIAEYDKHADVEYSEDDDDGAITAKLPAGDTGTFEIVVAEYWITVSRSDGWYEQKGECDEVNDVVGLMFAMDAAAKALNDRLGLSWS